ncbi:MAG: DUF493 domain-containing protein [Desulfuromonadales bacterium]|jgi:putative lipoic acid-binding regulatory protein
MTDRSRIDELVQFPCDFEFKAFGPNGAIFPEAVRTAIDNLVPVPRDAIRIRSSAQSSYICVSVLVRLHNARQIEDIYAALRRVEGLKYLL